MSKQDRQGARTPADVQRRFDGSFAEIEQTVKQIDSKIEAELSLKIGSDESGKVISMINASADTIFIKGNRLIIESSNFELTQDGTVKAKAGEIGGCSINNGILQIKNVNIGEKLTADNINADGIKAENVDISGKITASEGNICGWELGFATIPTGLKADGTESTVLEGALYSGMEVYDTADFRVYACETWLTSRGVYCKVEHHDETGAYVSTEYYHKKWWELLKG